MPEAFRARRIFSLAGEAPARSRSALDAPLTALDDGVVIARSGIIESVEPYSLFRRGKKNGLRFHDLGDVCVAPGLINAHCHLELSHLAGKTARGQGFPAWLRSLVPLIKQPTSRHDLELAVTGALEQLFAAGVAHVGDVGSRFPALVSAIAESAAADRGAPYPLTHFLESFGFEGDRRIERGLSDGPAFGPDQAGEAPATASGVPFMPRVASLMTGRRRADSSIAGHALYSTGPETLRTASYWSWERGRVFSLHLAESEDEDQCLRDGRGALFDIFNEAVLPADWKAPGFGPVRYAAELHLLCPYTLAVHCVHCSPEDIERLALNGVNVCLCPRSNVYIGVGTAPAGAMAEAGVLLCLGTDGLTSNNDLNMQAEMAAAVNVYGLSPRAALRMASLNGAYALGLPRLGALAPGAAAVFSLLDSDYAGEL
ncbi:MAG: amidohydrolase family protein [Desulfovibrio sp.]|jgi:cytosine/adenosine deaminase-related metal-dependent hydrolase|nr:amidohydrolase family protein [Desulfovibrio sp.]